MRTFRAIGICAVVLLVAGCGDDGASPPSAPTSAEATTTEPVDVTTTAEVATTTTQAASTTVADTAVPTTVAAEGVTALAAGPLSPRSAVAAAAVAGRIVIYGGQAGGVALDDGAAYDPATGEWSELVSSNGLAAGASAALPVGTAVVLAGSGGVALLDVAAGTWTALDPSPYPQGRLITSAATMLAVESDPARGAAGAPGAQGVAVLDPVAGTWSALPPVPVAEIVDVEVADGAVVVVGLAGTDAPDRVALRLDGDAWVDLAMPALDWFFGSYAFTDGTDVFVWANASPAGPDPDAHGVAYSTATGAWRETAPLPGDAWECYAGVVAVGDVLYVDNCASTGRYDVASDVLVPGADLAPEAQSTEALVALDGAVYRWGPAFCYAECSDPPEAVWFHRLAAGL